MITGNTKKISKAIGLLALLVTNHVLGGDQPSVQSAVDDLQIEVDGKCQYFDYDKYVLINKSTDKRIVANIRTDGDVRTHKYRDKNGFVQEDSYPKFRDYLLSPGKQQMIGCATANWREVVISQNFSIAGAYYAGEDFTLPQKDDPADYFRVYRTEVDVCSGMGGEIAWFANAHPFRAITISGKSIIPGFGTEYWQATLPPMVSRNSQCIGGPNGQALLQSASFSSSNVKDVRIKRGSKPISNEE